MLYNFLPDLQGKGSTNQNSSFLKVCPFLGTGFINKPKNSYQLKVGERETRNTCKQNI